MARHPLLPSVRAPASGRRPDPGAVRSLEVEATATSGPKVSACYDSAGSDADNNPRALALNLGVDGTGGGIGPTGKFVIRFQKNLAAQTSLPATLFLSNSKPSNFAPSIGFN